MTPRVLLSFVLLLGALPARASDETASDLTQMGLVGEWSRDCAADDVRWQILVDAQGVPFSRVYDQTTGQTLNLVKITDVIRPNNETLMLTVERSPNENAAQAKYEISGNSMRLVGYRGGYCVDAVVNGRTQSGVEQPLLNRCDSGRIVPSYGPRPTGYSAPSGCVAESGAAVESGIAVQSGVAVENGYAAASGRAVESGRAVSSGVAVSSGRAVASGNAVSSGYPAGSGRAVQSGYAASSGQVVFSGSTVSSGRSAVSGVAVQSGVSASSGSAVQSGRSIASGHSTASGLAVATQPVADAKPAQTQSQYALVPTNAGNVQVFQNGKLIATTTPQNAAQYGFRNPPPTGVTTVRTATTSPKGGPEAGRQKSSSSSASLPQTSLDMRVAHSTPSTVPNTNSTIAAQFVDSKGGKALISGVESGGSDLLKNINVVRYVPWVSLAVDTALSYKTGGLQSVEKSISNMTVATAAGSLAAGAATLAGQPEAAVAAQRITTGVVAAACEFGNYCTRIVSAVYNIDKAIYKEVFPSVTSTVLILSPLLP